MTCTNCETARTFPEYRMFDPACLHCGARLIQLLGRLPIGASECTARRRNELAIWLHHGHQEADLRSLAKGPIPLAPGGQDPSLESAVLIPVKPRLRGKK